MIRLKKSWAKILGTQIICADCSQPTPRTGPSQRYCVACSEKRASARKLKWANANPAERENAIGWQRNKRSRQLEVGAAVSEGNRVPLESVFPDETGMAWVRRLAVPFDYAMSKNHMSRLSGTGHVYLRKESKQVRSRLSAEVRDALKGVEVVQAKLWIDLIVHKPNHRGDAVNVLDLVIDGIKDALPVDDRWYCIRGLDWHIVKDAPLILIGLGQSETTNHRACSYCGRILPFAAFSSHRGILDDISRGCKECASASKRTR